MRAWQVIGAAIVLCGWTAGATPEPVGAADREADHNALRALRAQFFAAVNRQDVQALTALLAQEFVITSADQVVVTNRDDFAAYYDRMFKAKDAPIAKMEVTGQADILTRFAGEDAGYCYGSAVAIYTLRDGRVVRLDERWTVVVRKEDGAWKLAAAHLGVNFLDNPVLAARSLLVRRTIAIAAAVCFGFALLALLAVRATRRGRPEGRRHP